VNAWFIEFMERARNVLRERPCAKVVADPFLIAECLEAASGCHTCRPSAFLDLSVFIGEHFAVEVEKAIDTVSIVNLVLCVRADPWCRKVELDISF
jgi:hypothetical protein